MKLYTVIILLLVGSTVSGQNISGVVNTYHRVTAINTTTNTLSLSSAAGLSPGVKVLIIQMKGAAIDLTNSASFGNITSLGNAGNYEFNYVCGVTGNDILLMFNLQRSYTVSGMVQVVSVPRYTDAVVTDTLRAAPWDPVQGTGGIIAIQASNSISLLAPIDANGMGFNGGAYVDHPSPGYTCSWNTTVNAFYLSNPASGVQLGGTKGEGVATVASNMAMGKGKLANGGGGGNNHNSGGAGGGNYATGGNGGIRSNEGTFDCHAQHPGVGGLALSAYGYSAGNNRIFLGGGGGAGQGNNNVGMPGANGGGIVYILTPTLNGNNQLIRANGLRPYRPDIADPWSAGGDGGGGGGAGGVVILDVDTYAGSVTVEAQGGHGSHSSYTPSPGCFGPGGGGSGGVIWVKGAAVNPLVSASVTGGVNGLVSMTAGITACRGQANNATPGGNGAVVTNYTPVVADNLVCAPLPVNDLIYFTGKEIKDGIELNWKMRRTTDIQRYEVERSLDNLNYAAIATVVNNRQSNFFITDKDALSGYVYYRLKIIYANGSRSYSPALTVFVKDHNSLQLLRMSPNPAINKMELLVKTASQGNCEVEIYNSTAQKLSGRKYLVRKGVNQIPVQLDHLAAGVYFLHINHDGNRVVRSFVKTPRP